MTIFSSGTQFWSLIPIQIQVLVSMCFEILVLVFVFTVNWPKDAIPDGSRFGFLASGFVREEKKGPESTSWKSTARVIDGARGGFVKRGVGRNKCRRGGLAV